MTNSGIADIVQKLGCFLVTMLLIDIAGCVNPCVERGDCPPPPVSCEETNDCPPPPSPKPYPEPFSVNNHLIEQLNEMVVQVNSSTSAPVKVEVPDMFAADVEAAIDPNILELTAGTTDTPDIIIASITSIDGNWGTSSSRADYTPAIFRHRVAEDKSRYTLQIELNDNLSSVLPQYFPPTGEMTKIAVVSHLRVLASEPRYHCALQNMAETINLHQPDYVYVLGDMVYKSTGSRMFKLDELFLNKLTSQFIYVPGNHEYFVSGYTTWKERYGDPEPVIKTAHVNLVSLDSEKSIDTFNRQYLNNALNNLIDESKPTWILTHHRIWESNHNNAWYMHNFTPEEVMPLLEGKVDAIITGDAGHDIIRTSPPPSATIVGFELGTHSPATKYTAYDRRTPLFFGLMSIGTSTEPGTKAVPRLNPVYLDFEDESDTYYGTPDFMNAWTGTAGVCP